MSAQMILLKLFFFIFYFIINESRSFASQSTGIFKIFMKAQQNEWFLITLISTSHYKIKNREREKERRNSLY